MQPPKSYKVTCVDGPPKMDSLPVAKLCLYPLEQRDYRPFAQGILCVGGDRLYLRMWAFEVSPMPTSTLRCVLYPFAESPELGLSLRFEHGERDTVHLHTELLDGGADTPGAGRDIAAEAERHPHNGEDLQGVYWGLQVSLPLEALRRAGGDLLLTPGATVPGNFYKTCGDARFAHMGSYFPARFPDHPYGRESMGAFALIAY